MKVEIRNLGVITEAQIDLKPLTIFVGPNNAGKTWLAYTLAGIFGQQGFEEYKRAYVLNTVEDAYPPLETAIQQILDEGNAKIDLMQFADVYGEIYINNVANYAKHWIQKFINSESPSLKDLAIHITLAERKKDFLDKVLESHLEGKLSVGRSLKSPLLTTLKDAGNRELYMYTESEGDILEKLPARAIKEFLTESVFSALHNALYPQTRIFPAERTTLITFPFNNSKLTSEIFVAGGISFPHYSQVLMKPVSDFIDVVATMFQSSYSRRKSEAMTDKAKQNYMQIAQLLETQVLHGGLDFSTPEPDLRRVILFEPKKGSILEIPVVSSMVKELASLVLYLRYIAQEKELLVIDEPEMNLHPEAQAYLTEIMTMLVNNNLNILLTTHSPYVVDHLANLIKAAEHDDQEVIQNEFFLKQSQTFISKDNVSVYLVDQGTTKSILGEDGLIYWDTFSEISDKVTQIYFKL